MEFCSEFDDDVYFAHLKRQLLMLMVDEEDDFTAISNLPLLQYAPTSHDSPRDGKENHSNKLQVKSWEHLKKESNGTGVFIPSFTPQKKGKRGKVIYANRLVSGRIPKSKK